MSASHHTVWDLVGVPHEYSHVAGAALVGVVLTAVGLRIKSQLSKPEKYLLPESGVSLLNISTTFVGGFKNLLDGMIGHDADKFLAYICTTFLFLLLSNFMGLLPGFPPPTENFNTGLGLAMIALVVYIWSGIRSQGLVGYLKHYTAGLPPRGFSLAMTTILSVVALLLFCIEAVTHLMIRPLSLSLRLWGNINGDHTLVGVFSGLMPLGLPIVAMVLGVLVCLIQAFVFSLLSAVYIKLAVSHDH